MHIYRYILKKKKKKYVYFLNKTHHSNFKSKFLKILGLATEYSQAIKNVEHIFNFQLIFMPHPSLREI